MRKDVRRSLLLAYAVAGKLATDPDGVRARARAQLEHLRRVHRVGELPASPLSASLNEWERLLDGPLEDLLAALTEASEHADWMRSNAPFAGVLSTEERLAVLEAAGLNPAALAEARTHRESS